MDTRYTNAIDSNVATMMLYGEIGSPDMSAEFFTQEMKWHNSLGRQIKVYINSPGGNVFGGYSIIQAIIDYEADTHIVGLAASMGGIIAQFGKKRTANDFAVGMIHMPSGAEDKLLKLVAASLLDILVARCNKPKNEIEDLMAEETFFSAEEMLDIGLIDEIVTTNVATVENVTELSVGDLYNVFNNLLNENSEMKKLKDHFKLSGEVTEDIVLNSIAELENVIQTNTEEMAAKDAEISKAQSDLEEMRTEYAILNDSLAETIVDNAIADGKIPKDTKDVWFDAAKKDSAAVKAQLQSLKSIQNISVQTSVINGQPQAKKPEDDIVNWVRSKEGAQKLMELEKDDKDEFERIWNLYEDTLNTKK
jgi:ATP-dependent protease ClpP protease subunit